MIQKTILFFCLMLFILYIKAETQNFNLPDLITKSLDYHPLIKSSIYLENAAKQGVQSAKWQYFPTPQISTSKVNTSETDINYSGDKHIEKISFTQPIWAGGRLDAILEKSQAELILRQAVRKINEQDVAFNIIRAYTTWTRNYLKYQAFLRSKKEHDALGVRIKRRIEEGISSSSELHLLSSRLDQVKSNINTFKARYKNSLLRLSILVGIPLDLENLVKNMAGDYNITGEQENLAKKMFLINPRLKQLVAQIKIAQTKIEETKAQLSPNFRLKLERQWGNFSRSNSSPENRIFFELFSNFGAGLSNFSEINKAELAYSAAKFALQAEKDKILAQFKTDWALYQSLFMQKELLTSALKEAKKTQYSWYRQFLAGKKSWQDVMNSVREVSQLESQLADKNSEITLINWNLAIQIYGIRQTILKQSLNKITKN